MQQRARKMMTERGRKNRFIRSFDSERLSLPAAAEGKRLDLHVGSNYVKDASRRLLEAAFRKLQPLKIDFHMKTTLGQSLLVFGATMLASAARLLLRNSRCSAHNRSRSVAVRWRRFVYVPGWNPGFGIGGHKENPLTKTDHEAARRKFCAERRRRGGDSWETIDSVGRKKHSHLGSWPDW